ncbi:bile acid:sodium symporter [bacterium]|nr:bile acid:sodium symporter [bacterium]
MNKSHGSNALHERLYHFLHENMLVCLLACYGLAVLLPGVGLFLRKVSFAHPSASGFSFPLPMLMLSFLLFNAGLSCQVSQLKKLLRSTHILLAGVCANFTFPLVFTLVFAAFGHFWHNNDEIQNILVGLAIISSMPIAGSSAAWVQSAGGNPALILGLVVLSTVLSPLTTPLVFNLVAKVTVGDYSEDLSEIASSGAGGFLALSVVIPSLLGMALRHFLAPNTFQKIVPYFRLANIANLFVLNYINASTALPQAFANPDYDFLALIMAVVVVLCVTSFVLGWQGPRFFKLDKEDRTALTFGLGMNNNGTGLVLASLALADHPTVMIPIIFYNLGQQIVAGVFQSALTKHPKALSPQEFRKAS